MIPDRRRPALEIYTPLPPMRTGIGDYSAALLPLLVPHYRITAVIEDGAPPPTPLPGVRIVRIGAHTPSSHALAVYMLGNNPDHLYQLGPLSCRPGLVVLHDPGLHNLLDCATAALGDAPGYAAALRAEYGQPGTVLGAQWQRHRLREAALPHRLPMLGQILGPQRHVLVHSAYAAWKVAAGAPETPLGIVPHLAVPAQPLPDPARLRARLGVPPDALLLASLGFASSIKRIDTVLRVLARIGPRLPDFRYLIAGQIQPDEIDLPALVARLGLHGRVIATGYVADEDLPGIAALADIVLNLRHPVAGETSGTLVRALGAGACSIVIDDGPFAELPDDAVVKLQWGPMLERDLADALLRLARDPKLRQAIGAAASRTIARNCDPQQVVARYRAGIEAARRTPVRPYRRAVPLSTPPPQAAMPGQAPLWWRARALPLLEGPGTLLALAPRSDLAWLHRFGQTPTRIDRPGLIAAPPRAAAAALLVLHRRAAAAAERDLLRALNRALGFGGVCAIELRGLAPDARPLASRAAGGALLARLGFAAEPAEPIADTPPARPRLVWRATKISEACDDG